jgi:signal peptidase I
MSALTGILYAALVAYLGGWYVGRWTGNFALLLFVLTSVTMLYWLAERFYFAPARSKAAQTLVEGDAKRREALAAQGISRVDGDIEPARQQILQQPWWLDWTAGLFPVILVVFLLRSFLFEPFKIPSGSMVPTLLVGDLILVNKFHYGVRLPVLNKKIIANHDVKRGDVMVFRYPEDPSTDFIKRVVGIPGDEVSYVNQKLYVNGQLAATQPVDNFYDDSPTRVSAALHGKARRQSAPDPCAARRPALLPSGSRRRPFSLPAKLPLHRGKRDLQGACWPLLHDGRQPRQLARFALLGIRPRRKHRRQGLHGLDEFR